MESLASYLTGESMPGLRSFTLSWGRVSRIAESMSRPWSKARMARSSEGARLAESTAVLSPMAGSTAVLSGTLSFVCFRLCCHSDERSTLVAAV